MLTNKTALVTGSTSGIGYAIAEALAKMNANIIINGLPSNDNCTTLVENLSNLTSGKVMFEAADLSKPMEIERMMQNIFQNFGEIDILVNNAGIQFVSPLETFPVEKWDTIISLNLSSVFHTTRHVLRKMKNKGWGRIINIASAHGLVASISKAAYVTAKHGVVGLTKVTALETAPFNITANAICPGWVLTPLVQNQIDALAQAQNISMQDATMILLNEKQPTKQFIKPSDIGELVVFLCTVAANQVTGAAWSIDGGWTCQ